MFYDKLVQRRQQRALYGSDLYKCPQQEAKTVPPDRGVRRTLVLTFGNRYPEWMPFLTSDRGQDSNPYA
ncbi:hypothetical protein E2C01_041008 [Portunus trituberculatus]|uniref:Uncharacterized protein n=1 Tax=Portunus trituberculatus TaxID=210409 RepID=A0A5B7FP87_PORTR|nr:hypothetical protein [Portunus trituberculatus]